MSTPVAGSEGLRGSDAAAASGTSASPHQLNFYQAMADFKAMFPMMDDEIIEAVLRANWGAVDETIDQLLTMSCDITPDSVEDVLEDNESIPICGKSKQTTRTLAETKIKVCKY